MKSITLTNKWGNKITVAIGSRIGWKPSSGSEQIRRVRDISGSEAKVNLGSDEREYLGWVSLSECWSEG